MHYLFRGYDQRFGRFDISSISDSGKHQGKAVTYDRPPNESDFIHHINGNSGIGIIPLTRSNTVHFAAIDIDDYTFPLEKILNFVKDKPLIVTKSKSGGFHVWLFSKEGLPASLAVSLLKEYAGILGVGNSEIFPKQIERVNANDIGNWINLPYFGNTRKAIDPDSPQDLTLNEFLKRARRLSLINNETFVRNILNELRGNTNTTNNLGNTTDISISDGPVCLESIINNNLFKEGQRNIILFNLAVYYRRVSDDKETVKTRLLSINNRLTKRLSDSEINTIISSVFKKQYGYKCHEPCLQANCRKEVCKERVYGVGTNNSDNMVTIDGLNRIMTYPVSYVFNANGKRVLIKDTDTLYNSDKMRNAIFEATNVRLPVMSKSEFEEYMKSHIGNIEDIYLSREADSRSLIKDHLEEFLHNFRTDRKDMLERGSAYFAPDGFIYFKYNQFKRYLTSVKYKIDDHVLLDYLQNSLCIVPEEGSLKVNKVFLHFNDGIELEETLGSPF